MSSEPLPTRPSVIEVQGLGKSYQRYRRPLDRLWQALWPRAGTRAAEEFWPLREVTFSMRQGEALGIVGVNGAGKSTLLQLVAGTLRPSAGQVRTRGRVAALLELGSGFNPEFTGRENVFLNAATLGLSKREIEARFDAIVDFAGIGAHIDQPVKTYSSGMFVRLAFAIATSVEPDILIVDEALSVGDGAFARRSFDRIMDIKARGATILFCSHALFHIEVFCDAVLWLHEGRVREYGPVTRVLGHYQEFLDQLAAPPAAAVTSAAEPVSAVGTAVPAALAGHARIDAVRVWLDGVLGDELYGESACSRLRVEIDFHADPALPAPSAVVVLSSDSGRILATQFSLQSACVLQRSPTGRGTAVFECADLLLNKGRYRVGAYLACERGVHVYQWIDPVAHINLHRATLDLGFFVLPGKWSGRPRLDADQPGPVALEGMDAR